MYYAIRNRKADRQIQKFEHNLWLHDINYKTEEIAMYKLQLDKIYSISDRNKLYAQTKKYRTLLNRQIEVLQSLKTSILNHEQEIQDAYYTAKIEEDHAGSRMAIESYEKIYREMIQEVKHFLVDTWIEQNG